MVNIELELFMETKMGITYKVMTSGLSEPNLDERINKFMKMGLVKVVPESSDEYCEFITIDRLSRFIVKEVKG